MMSTNNPITTNTSSSVCGIRNVSGVGCHLSSAIVVLCYALVPLRQALIHLLECHDNNNHNNSQPAICTPESQALLELARLLHEMVTTTTTSSSVDPSRVFAAFSSQCNPYELGDATRAMAALLKRIRSIYNNNKKNDNTQEEETNNPSIGKAKEEFKSFYEGLLGGPTAMQQSLVGTKRMVPRSSLTTAEQEATALKQIEIETETVTIIRHKQKRVPMPCPFPVDCSTADSTSLQEAFQEALAPKPVKGYNWDRDPGNSMDYEQSIQPDESSHQARGSDEEESSSSTSDWTTSKQTTFCHPLPAFLLLHLQRFEYHQRHGQIQATQGIMEIPLQLEVPCHDGDNKDDINSTYYSLVGGILHVEDEDADTQSEDYEGGHYVAVCQDDDNNWFLINDEKVIPLKETVVLDLLAGKAHSSNIAANLTDNAGTIMRGVMLVYSCWDEQKCKLSIVNESLSRLAEEGKTILPTVPKEQQLAYNMVGKRLRIRWAKGKFYAGKVTSYNATTGKHSVQYDDGDVREYLLHKKTIEWEDE
ncbi:expressed unknown protein [Seminavis robusta]|uniref:USP domain-containing protein n=1 Tax=Seminavis robusta TaxID=568900 RepID=A0A9N8HAB6_9STRA|nr:expressed unknown protein [Seminavis robusta]|eukprot:Sro289_g109070.1 n/a (533) ;mRNA; f:26960-28558